MAARRLSRRQKRILQWFAAAHQRTSGMITSSHQDLGRVLPGDKGAYSSDSCHPIRCKAGSWPIYVNAEEVSQFEWISEPTLTR
jgi:hypothetical protein